MVRHKRILFILPPPSHLLPSSSTPRFFFLENSSIPDFCVSDPPPIPCSIVLYGAEMGLRKRMQLDSTHWGSLLPPPFRSPFDVVPSGNSRMQDSRRSVPPPAAASPSL